MLRKYSDAVRPADVAALAPHIFSMHSFVRGDLSFLVVGPKHQEVHLPWVMTPFA
jgi:hypothetical protein